MGATVAGYDGIPYTELAIVAVVWTDEQAEHIRTRSERYSDTQMDVEPEWATEAVADPRAWVGDGRSKTGETIKVIGWSPSAMDQDGVRGVLLKVLLRPAERPPAGLWLGVTAMKANSTDRRYYREG